MTEGRLIAGRYRLTSTVGSGGMGTVWRAWDETLSRDVAVKEVRYPPGLSEEEQAAQYRRSMREARSAARLSHPGVVTVHDVVEEDGRPWVVMEFIHGRSLQQVIKRDGPLSAERVASIGAQVLTALSAAHALGILHRDVKPGNILLADDNRVVLTDFGIAMITGETSITQTGRVIGSPAYIAPERLRGEPTTPAADLWALGVTLYTAVEGSPPFDRPDPAAVYGALLDPDPAPAPRAAGALSPVIEGLLRKDAGRRWNTVTAMERLRALCPPAGGYGYHGTAVGGPALGAQPSATPAAAAAGPAGSVALGRPVDGAQPAAWVAASTGAGTGDAPGDGRFARLFGSIALAMMALAVLGTLYSIWRADNGVPARPTLGLTLGLFFALAGACQLPLVAALSGAHYARRSGLSLTVLVTGVAGSACLVAYGCAYARPVATELMGRGLWILAWLWLVPAAALLWSRSRPTAAAVWIGCTALEVAGLAQYVVSTALPSVREYGIGPGGAALIAVVTGVGYAAWVTPLARGIAPRDPVARVPLAQPVPAPAGPAGPGQQADRKAVQAGQGP